jgi:hypothetical protein
MTRTRVTGVIVRTNTVNKPRKSSTPCMQGRIYLPDVHAAQHIGLALAFLQRDVRAGVLSGTQPHIPRFIHLGNSLELIKGDGRYVNTGRKMSKNFRKFSSGICLDINRSWDGLCARRRFVRGLNLIERLLAPY